jgi:hypothetical protein
VSLNQAEEDALTDYSRAAGNLLRLIARDQCHPDEVTEVRTHIHVVQGLVMARAAVRDHLNEFTHLSSFCGSDRGFASICHADHQEVKP